MWLPKKQNAHGWIIYHDILSYTLVLIKKYLDCKLNKIFFIFTLKQIFILYLIIISFKCSVVLNWRRAWQVNFLSLISSRATGIYIEYIYISIEGTRLLSFSILTKHFLFDHLHLCIVITTTLNDIFYDNAFRSTYCNIIQCDSVTLYLFISNKTKCLNNLCNENCTFSKKKENW